MVSIKHRLPIYDSIYIALALQLKMKLATYDTKQSAIMRQEETTRAAQTLDQRP